MAELKHGVKIKQVWTTESEHWEVGQLEVKEMSINMEEYGGDRYAPWIKCTMEDGTVRMFNCSNVVYLVLEKKE